MTQFNVDTKTLIIIVLSISLLVCTDGCGYFADTEIKETTTTTVDTVYVKQRETSNKQNTSSDTTDQDVLITGDDVKEVEPSRKLTPEEKKTGAEIKTVKKLTEVTKLDNGTITGNILYTGELLSTSYLLETNTLQITERNTTIKKIPQSGLYGYAGSTLGITGNINSLELGVLYAYKNKAFISGGINYVVDPFIMIPPPQRIGLSIKLGIRL